MKDMKCMKGKQRSLLLPSPSAFSAFFRVGSSGGLGKNRWLLLPLLLFLGSVGLSACQSSQSFEVIFTAVPGTGTPLSATALSATQEAVVQTFTPAAPPGSGPTATPTVTPMPRPTATPTSTPLPTAIPIPRPVATLNPAGQVGLGIYTDDVPYDGFRSVYVFEQSIGHKMAYVLWFHAWGDADREFPTAYVRAASQMGLTPVITWEPWKRDFDDPSAVQPAYSLESIAAGEHDEYVRSWARAARDVDVPIILRFAHEQSTEPGDRPWYPWQGDPEGYRAAFRHVVGLFREEGAGKVRFL